MKHRRLLTTSAAVLVAAIVAAGALQAAAPASAPGAKPATPSKSAPPAMDPNAMMAAYARAATPGPEHAEMAKMAGDWKLDVSSWMAPGAPPEKSTATAKFESILGGRYLRQTVDGTMGGQPFQGSGTEGFDNATKERWSTWVDNMGTGMMVSKGKCPAGAKTCTMHGSFSDPLSGKAMTCREVMTKNGDNSFTFDMYGPDPAGKEFHMMQIVYTRQ